MAIERIKEFWPDWNVEEILGKGSYGTVYKVRRDYLGKVSYSAIKEIGVPADSSEVRALRSEGMTVDDTKKYFHDIVMDFSNEIKLMDSLKSASNIVSVEDFKVLEKEDGIGWDIYIRMELLEPFENVMQKGIITEEEVVKLGIDLCSALEACQKFNIIHRDIKPANIFLSPFGDYKLGDFGVARELEKTVTNMSKKGTYTYMAPEVMKDNTYDHRADIYSLGIVMYTLLNGNRGPFLDAGTANVTYDAKQNAMNRRLMGEALPAPSGASPELAEIVLSACAFDVNRRFSSPTALKNALNAYSGVKSVSGNNNAANGIPDINQTMVEGGGNGDGLDKTVRVKVAAEQSSDINQTKVEDGDVGSSDNAADKNKRTKAAAQSQKKTKGAVKNGKRSSLPIIIVLALILIGGAIAAYLILDPFKSEEKPSSDKETTTETTDKGDKDDTTDDINTDDIGNTEDDNIIGGVSSSVSWEYKDGTLTVKGTGAMSDYTYDYDSNTSNAPWGDYVDDIDTIVIKKGVTHIGKSAFENFPALKKVTLPDGLESIGEGAFYKCEKLTSIEIPDSVTEIGGWAFSWCSSLDEIKMSENLEILGDCAFQGCAKLKSINLYDVVYRIGENVFKDCSSSLKIICSEGSYAESYADSYGINVKNS